MSTNAILLVDDEPNVLAALKRCLMEEEDILVHAVGRADEALELMAEEHVDVVISDHDMPGMNGMDFLEFVAQRHPDVVRMMLSGKADLAAALEAVNNESIYRFLVKPWEEAEVRVMVRLALRHRDDAMRVKELSRIVSAQAQLFAEIIARHPDCAELVEKYMLEEAEEESAERATVG